jgi:hypothetical protein
MFACALKFAALFLAVPALAESSAELVEQRNAENPFATFSVDALTSQNVGGCFNAPTPPQLAASAERAKFSFTDEEIRVARDEKVAINWVKSGAVGPIQQQHPCEQICRACMNPSPHSLPISFCRWHMLGVQHGRCN